MVCSVKVLVIAFNERFLAIFFWFIEQEESLFLPFAGAVGLNVSLKFTNLISGVLCRILTELWPGLIADEFHFLCN